MIGIIIFAATVIGFITVLYRLHRKVDNLTLTISDRLKTLNENCETLRKNDETLSKDIGILFREHKKTNKDKRKK